jgi:uncharacterized protein (TIGR02117 family)
VYPRLGRLPGNIEAAKRDGANLARILRWLVRISACLVLLVALGTLVPRPFSAPGEVATGGAIHHVLILSNPIHTDFAIPVDAAVLARFSFLQDAGIPIANPAVRYIIFGWGGRSFYLQTPTWSELKAGPALRSLTIDASVMHVDVAAAIAEPQEGISGFDLNDASFNALLDFIDESFKRDGGAIEPIVGYAYGPYDRFFEARGRFNALLGCNTWTAAGLRRAGLRTGVWNPLPVFLNISLNLFN